MMAAFQATRIRILAVAVLAAGVVAPAAAQPPDAPRSFTVEEIDNGWIVGPDFRITEVDDEVSTVAGVYGGYLIDRRLLVGAGAYWLEGDRTDLRYFGPLIEWSTKTGGRFDLALRALVGVGSATRDADFGDIFDTEIVGVPARFGRRFGRGFGRGFGRYYDEVVVAEPHISLLTRVTDWLGVNAGVGYRATSGDFAPGNSLDGASFSIGVRFGPS